MGVVTVFLALYLWLFRQHLRFPHPSGWCSSVSWRAGWPMRSA
jgi:hypothetical protein